MKGTKVMKLSALATLLIAFAAPKALAWDPFVTENSNVDTGNARMAAGDAEGALAAYDLAAREHPESAEVQLNRGLALLAAGSLPEAREALVAAADPDADETIRASAYYDLGLAFYQEGDAAAAEEDHQRAQGQFREAADALRRSLRLKPGNRNAAWNLELALRRIREQEEAQEQQEQEQQDQQDQDQQQDGDQNQDQNGQDQDQQDPNGDQQDQDQQNGDENQDQNGDEQNQDPQGGDEQEQDEQNGGDGDEQNQDEQSGDEQNQDQNGDEQNQDQQSGDEQQQEGNEEQSGAEQGSDSSDGNQGESDPGEGALPRRVERVLDALQDREQNLERARARARAARENRRVLRDW